MTALLNMTASAALTGNRGAVEELRKQKDAELEQELIRQRSQMQQVTPTPREQEIQAQLPGLEEKANAGFFETAKNNPLDLTKTFLNLAFMTAGGGPLGAILGMMSGIESIDGLRDQAAMEAAGLREELDNERNERAARVMQVLIGRPELLLDDDFNNMVRPDVLGIMASVGIPLNTGAFVRMKQNTTLYTHTLPELIKAFPNLSRDGRIALLEDARRQGLRLTDEQIMAIASNEQRDAEEWGKVFDPYTLSLGMLYASNSGLHPTDGLNDPSTILFMAGQQAEKELKDQAGISLTDADRAEGQRIYTQIKEWANANPDAAKDLSGDPQGLAMAAGVNPAEFDFLVSKYNGFGQGLSRAEVRKILLEGFANGVFNSAELASLINKPDFVGDKLGTFDEIYDYVNHSVFAAADKFIAVSRGNMVTAVRDRAAEIRASDPKISEVEAMQQAIEEFKELGPPDPDEEN